MCGGPGSGGSVRFARSQRSGLSQLRGSSPWMVIPPESRAIVALSLASAAQIGRSTVSRWPPAAVQYLLPPTYNEDLYANELLAVCVYAIYIILYGQGTVSCARPPLRKH